MQVRILSSALNDEKWSDRAIFIFYVTTLTPFSARIFPVASHLPAGAGRMISGSSFLYFRTSVCLHCRKRNIPAEKHVIIPYNCYKQFFFIKGTIYV